MAITDIQIVQDNIVSGSNLLPVHSPLVFIAEATYSGVAPNVLLIEIYDIDSNLLESARCIPYSDPTETTRQFVFKASRLIRSLMEKLDDIFQSNETLVHIPEMTKQLRLKFVSPDDGLIFDEQTFVFIHGAEQFGSYPNKQDVFNNEPDTYYAPKDSTVYVYFYNDDPANTLAVNGVFIDFEAAADFDDVEFADFDDEIFEIL